MDELTTQIEPPHSHRLRNGRMTLRSAVYLVTAVTSARRPLFANADLATVAGNALQHYHDRNWVHGFAWVVMPDHIHWLCQLRVGTLQNLVRMFKVWTATQIKKQLTDPPLRIWQPGFYERMVRPHERLEPYIGYVVGNPVRRGLVENHTEYPHLFAETDVAPVLERPWTE